MQGVGKEVAAFVLSLAPTTEACFLMEQEARRPGLGSLPSLHRAVFSPGRRRLSRLLVSTLICVLGPIRTASLHVTVLKAPFLNTAEQDLVP